VLARAVAVPVDPALPQRRRQHAFSQTDLRQDTDKLQKKAA
jgi:hypothetical protein